MLRLRPVVVFATSLVVLAASTASAAAPFPDRAVSAPFPAPVGQVARSSPPALELVSDTRRTVRADPIPPLPNLAYAAPHEGEAYIQRFLPQGRLGFVLYGVDGASARYLVGVDPGKRRERYTFDLDGLARVQPATAADRSLVYAEIVWAREADGVLYVENAHSTYAASSRDRNAAITAIEIATGRVLWRSPSLVANARTFVLAPGNRIVSGYGFTREPDYLYVLDRATGKVLDRQPVPDAPEILTRRGNELRVETYSHSLRVRLTR